MKFFAVTLKLDIK